MRGTETGELQHEQKPIRRAGGGACKISAVVAVDGGYCRRAGGRGARIVLKDGEPADPHLQRRYRLYRRIEAPLALPAGLERTLGSIAARPAPSVLHPTLVFDGDRVDTIDPTHDVEQDEIAMACDVSQ